MTRKKHQTPPQGADGKFLKTGAPKRTRIKTMIATGGGNVTMDRVHGLGYEVNATLNGKRCKPYVTKKRADAMGAFVEYVAGESCLT